MLLHTRGGSDPKRHFLHHSMNLGIGRVAARNKLEKLSKLDSWKTFLSIESTSSTFSLVKICYCIGKTPCVCVYIYIYEYILILVVSVFLRQKTNFRKPILSPESLYLNTLESNFTNKRLC